MQPHVFGSSGIAALLGFLIDGCASGPTRSHHLHLVSFQLYARVAFPTRESMIRANKGAAVPVADGGYAKCASTSAGMQYAQSIVA